MSNSIFISYRREDASGYGGRLHDALCRHFGRDRVFRDVDSLRAGSDFVDSIMQAVAQSGAVLALIGRDWLTLTDEAGKRRLDDPNDFVRIEIAAAIEQKIVVIPVLLEGAKVPAPGQLPPPLAPLSRYHAIDLSEERWDYDVGRLAKRLEEVIGSPPTAMADDPGAGNRSPSPPPVPPKGYPFPRRPLAIGAAVFALALAVVVGVLAVGGGDEDPPDSIPEPAQAVEVQVPGKGPESGSPFGMRWTDTGVDAAEQLVTVTATGTVNAGDGNFVPPDGTPNRPDFDVANELKGPQHAGLIGKIGANGQPFVVGSFYRSSGKVSGRLFLGVNDIDQSNNEGQFAVTIKLE